MTHPSYIARPHRQQYVAGEQMGLQHAGDFIPVVDVETLGAVGPHVPGKVGGGHFPGLGRTFPGAEDVGHQQPVSILQAGGQFVQ